ncbi:holo-ACP synthase [Paenibacillus glycanilyticus]|uniref:Holo-[acyl-carrier-protein] synthase n=1 Tax=Paenibacillus glycanilyticus TaxID=126569 RepID=A0ABQ6GAA7_9BACL|nr:holo-ACP synthase [Paenibacillus glycanilyticus]GLX66183.1 holo-[acyl-carrier-protein] synthase [Paenibacillus glycanilyticus]
MIAGIGHDVTDMDRVEALLAGKAGDRFLSRILTSREREIADGYEGKRLVQFTAGRFAAKEAVVKALGCGIGALVGFADIDILRGPEGKPECTLSGQAWERLERMAENHRIHITITHDRSIASAVAIVEQTE